MWLSSIKQIKIVTFMAFLLLVCACAPTGRYYQQQDSAPRIIPEHVSTKDATPVFEPYAPANLRPYQVFGVNYRPLTSNYGYTDTGYASWYGQKFHGHKTSNGEIYDMYQMTAAHKTLPIPSYARITNLENGKQVIVRVNDRGPFHHGRIVDLSYAAALKIGVLQHGVAKVKLEAIHVAQDGKITIGKQPIIEPVKSLNNAKQSGKRFIQVLASGDPNKLNNIGQNLSQKLNTSYKIVSEKSIHKLWVGPFSSEKLVSLKMKQLAELGYKQTFRRE